jgi:hypothetical protein
MPWVSQRRSGIVCCETMDAMFIVRFRLGASGDVERQREEDARTYFDEHGVWPDEEQRKGRKWTLPAGVVTYEQE